MRFLPLIVILTGLLAIPAAGQEDASPSVPDTPETEPAVEMDPTALPTPDRLRLRLIPLRREALAVEAEAWVERVQLQAERLVELQTAGDPPAGTIQAVRTEGSSLIQLANEVLDALKAKGGDTTEFAAYLNAVAAAMSSPPPPPAVEGPEVPSLRPYDPLTVSPDELDLRLRRLRKAGLQDEVETWLTRLQVTTEEIAAVDIAARTRKGEEQAALIALSTSLKEQRAALIERTKIAIALLEERGGDVADARLYVKAVSGGLAADLADLAGADGNIAGAVINTIVAWAKSKEGGLTVLANVGKFLATLLIAWILASIGGRLVTATLKRLRRPPTALLQTFLRTMVRRVILLVGLVVAISNLGFDIAPLVAAIGAAGLVLGFALQGTLSNFASGILILLYRPFDVGDAVEVASVSGKVEAMTMVSTTITTFDNQLLIIPNNSVWNNVIKNITGKTTRRVDLTFGISYSDDMAKAQKILTEVVDAHPLVLAEPAPNIRVHALADSSVNFIVRPWAKTADYWEVYWDLTRTVKERFDEEGITIPFPQRDVHVHGAPVASA